MTESVSKDLVTRERLIREAKAASKLNHPNILTIHAVEFVDDRHFIVMEYIEGKSVTDYLYLKRSSIDEMLKLAIQISDGLQEAHSAGIVHRDLKPSNILVDSKGRVRILDFGLAKLKGASKLTKSGTTMGTLAYSSPEQASGGEVDHRSDLFSLGTVLYEMLAGRFPFQGSNNAELLYAIAYEEPEPLARFKAGVSDELQRIVSKCLKKNTDERYQSAADMRADLVALKREGAVRNVYPPARRRTGLVVYASVVAFAIVALFVFNPWQLVLKPTQEVEAGYKMLAVLPFDNLGPAEDEYFADGITDEITFRLARISALRVISRTSAMTYKNTDKTIPQIGAELGVDYILVGTILWDTSGDTDRVRITPQLIEVASDFHIWTDNIERPITKLFTVQADIATHISEALNVTLLEPEKMALEARPTENLDAYNAYLRALNLAGQLDFSPWHLQLTVDMFKRAVKLDNDFALAFALLSMSHSDLYHWGVDRTDERIRKAESAAKRALELQPELPEAHLAYGAYYYTGFRDYERAKEEWDVAERGLPNDSRVISALGTLHKRQGNFEKAIDYYRRGLEISPRDIRIALDLAVSHHFLRQFDEAEQYYDLTISLSPDAIVGYWSKLWLYARSLGDLKKARQLLQQTTVISDNNWMWFNLELLDRNYSAALQRTQSFQWEYFKTQQAYELRTLAEAWTYHFMGEERLALAAFDSTRPWLERELEELPKDERIHTSLGIAYAALGQKKKALLHGKRAVELLPVSTDAFNGPFYVKNLAIIYMLLGDQEAALDKLEYSLSIPSMWLSVAELRVDPTWDPLHDHPRFRKLVGE